MPSLFWNRVDTLPPIMVRLFARRRVIRNGRTIALSNSEISKASGLTQPHIFCLSESTDWEGVTIPHFRDFTHGCGVDFFDPDAMRYIANYLRRPNAIPSFSWLRLSPDWDYYEELLLKAAKARLFEPWIR